MEVVGGGDEACDRIDVPFARVPSCDEICESMRWSPALGDNVV